MRGVTQIVERDDVRVMFSSTGSSIWSTCCSPST